METLKGLMELDVDMFVVWGTVETGSDKSKQPSPGDSLSCIQTGNVPLKMLHQQYQLQVR